MKVSTYLNYGGNCQEAFRFYEKHLAARITSMMTFSQLPPPAKPPAPGMENAILHARMFLGDMEIMGNDVPPDRFQPMRSVYISIAVDSSEEAERIYKLLTDGGEIFMKMEETFFAYRFAMLRDKFGTSWMIIHERPMPPQH